VFLTSALGGGEWSALIIPGGCTFGKRAPVAHFIGGWGGVGWMMVITDLLLWGQELQYRVSSQQ